MRIAHISDLHLCTNFKRQNILNTIKLIRHALDNGAEHLIITGDISDNADDADFIIFRDILKQFNLLRTDKATIVVGNHDIYGGPQTAEDVYKFPQKCASTDYHRKLYRFVQHFRELFENTHRPTEEMFFPFVKVLDKVLLIGLNTIDLYSKLKNPFASNGHVSKTQRKLFSQLLHLPELKNKTKIVLAHHHFYKKNVISTSSRKTLWDKIEHFTMKLRGKKKLLNLFHENDVKLVLHGHSHEMMEYYRKGITLLNAGASVDSAVEPNSKTFLIDIFQSKMRINLSSIGNQEIAEPSLLSITLNRRNSAFIDSYNQK